MTKRIYALSIDNLCFDLSKVLKTLVEQSDRYEKEIERLNARVASLEELIGTRKQDFHDIVNGREIISTAEASSLLNRSPQTLRRWACKEDGPLKPTKISGKLGWKVSDLRRLLEVDKKQNVFNSGK